MTGAFPTSHDLVSQSFTVFGRVRDAITLLIPVVFLGKVAVYQIICAPAEKYGALVKSAVLFFLLCAGFPYFLELLITIPQSFSESLSAGVTLKEYSDNLKKESWTSVPVLLAMGVEVVSIVLYYMAYALYHLLIISLCAIGPVVFFLGTLFEMTGGLLIFFGLLFLGSTWPILWEGLNWASKSLVVQSDFASQIVNLIIMLLKLLAPGVLGILVSQTKLVQAARGAGSSYSGATKWISAGGVGVARRSINLARTARGRAQGDPREMNLEDSTASSSVKRRGKGFRSSSIGRADSGRSGWRPKPQAPTVPTSHEKAKFT